MSEFVGDGVRQGDAIVLIDRATPFRQTHAGHMRHAKCAEKNQRGAISAFQLTVRAASCRKLKTGFPISRFPSVPSKRSNKPSIFLSVQIVGSIWDCSNGGEQLRTRGIQEKVGSTVPATFEYRRQSNVMWDRQ